MTCELSKTVGERVRAVRKRVGLSQAALADKAGLCSTTVTHGENGTRNWTLAGLEKVAAALGARAGDLLQAAGPCPTCQDTPDGGLLCLACGERGAV